MNLNKIFAAAAGAAALPVALTRRVQATRAYLYTPVLATLVVVAAMLVLR